MGGQLDQMTKARIPKKARKLTFNDQEWFWRLTKYNWDVVIWSPEGEKHVVLGREILGIPKESWYQYTEYGPSQPILPGDVRKYIQDHILNDTPEFDKDPDAVLGKLYVYKHRDMDGAPLATIHSIEPTGFQTAKKFQDHLAAGRPVFLIQHWIDKEKELSFYKVLVESYMVVFKMTRPRTWKGSFVEADPEKDYD